MNFVDIIFIILQWSWGIIQNLVGLIIFLINIKQEHRYYKGTIITVWDKEDYCMGIGMFIFMNKQCPKDQDPKQSLPLQESFERMKVHEYGHTIQSIILGPLFLVVIGLPSCIWANIPRLKRYRKKNKISYYSFYPERWANYLGEYVTGCKSMGQAMVDF